MTKFIFTIPITVKRADGENFVIGMGQKKELNSTLQFEVVAEDVRDASVQLQTSIQNLLS